MKQNYTVRHGALEGVEAFLAVAGRASFRRAAADLGVTPSAVSQAVRTLEARLGAALFTRTTRSVGLTEAAAAVPGSRRAGLHGTRRGRRGGARPWPAPYRLAAAVGPTQHRAADPGAGDRVAFTRAYPEIELEIAASDEMVDLATGGFDAGIRMGQFIAPDMVAVRLTPPLPLVVVGSPDYLARRGRPERVDDLRHHACLRLRRSKTGRSPTGPSPLTLAPSARRPSTWPLPAR